LAGKFFLEHDMLEAPSDDHFWTSNGTSRLKRCLTGSSKLAREVACSGTKVVWSVD